MIDQDSMGFLDRVAYDDDYQGIALDTDEGERMARAFDGKPILLSRNHGLTTVGETVADAFNDMHYMERICAKQYRVAVSGKTPAMIPRRCSTGRTTAMSAATGPRPRSSCSTRSSANWTARRRTTETDS